MNTRGWGLAVGAVLLAGCGGSHHAASTGVTYHSPHDLADAIGMCSQTYNPERGAIAPADVATCQFDGHQLTLVTGSNEQRDATIEMASKLDAKFGGGSFESVVGSGWAVMVDSHLAAVEVQHAVGGTLR